MLQQLLHNDAILLDKMQQLNGDKERFLIFSLKKKWVVVGTRRLNFSFDPFAFLSIKSPAQRSGFLLSIDPSR